VMSQNPPGQPGPPATLRGRPRSTEVDEAILTAALDELVEHGFASMTIDGIAARAGVARTTVYRRWSSTDQLCMAAIERVREQLPRPPGHSVREDLIFLLGEVNRILTSTRFGQILPQLAAEAQRRPDLSRAYWTTYLTRGRGVISDVIRRGMAEGVITEGVITEGAAIEFVTDMLVGPLVHRLLWQLDPATDDNIVALVDTILAGLRPR
jgi:AcrR family transcriptional regulator